MSNRSEQSNESEDSNASIDPNVVVYTADEVLRAGLVVLKYTSKRIKRAKRKTNIERFKHHFGCPPLVAALIWEDLQTTAVPEAYLPPPKAKLQHFLMALYQLRKYPKELDRERQFDLSRNYSRDLVWFYLKKIQALKAEKIRWPDDNFGSDILAITVDGTHCWINEPQHAEWSLNSKYYSHKYGKAGVNYELGISLSQNRLVWMNGPFPAGESDSRVFKRHGLKHHLQSKGKRGIADGGYPGYARLLSTPNNQDKPEVRRFKRRALKRHETFNGMTKVFECLQGRFRHGVDRFATCFEAVAVICQYMIENGEPLYDIVVDGMFD